LPGAQPREILETEYHVYYISSLYALFYVLLWYGSSSGLALCPGDSVMAAKAENLETARLDSESESDFRKRHKLMTELGPDIVDALMRDRPRTWL
jgi:hypothetical protein